MNLNIQFESKGNVARGESLEFAAELDERYSQVWLGHPYFDVIDNSTSFEDKVNNYSINKISKYNDVIDTVLIMVLGKFLLSKFYLGKFQEFTGHAHY